MGSAAGRPGADGFGVGVAADGRRTGVALAATDGAVGGGAMGGQKRVIHQIHLGVFACELHWAVTSPVVPNSSWSLAHGAGNVKSPARFKAAPGHPSDYRESALRAIAVCTLQTKSEMPTHGNWSQGTVAGSTAVSLSRKPRAKAVSDRRAFASSVPAPGTG